MASASFAPLRHRGFALALSSNFISSTGTWMQSVALGIFLQSTTHNSLWLGLLTVAAWLPAVIGSPLGGVMADRYSRQRWIQFNNLIQAGTASALAVAALTHHLSAPLACYLAIAEGFCSSASWAAWQSLLPDLVEKDEVLAAVSLGSAQFNLGRILGPALAAITLLVGSPGWCFAANAVSFIVVVVAFSFVRTPARVRVTTKLAMVAETRVGMHVAWRIRGCRNAIIGVGIVAIFISPFITLVPAMAIDVLHSGKVGTTWLVTAQGVGAVIGALTLPGLARRTSRLVVLRGSMAVMAVIEGLYAYSPNMVWSSLALVVLGGSYVGTLTGLNTSVQLHAPAKERSRILSLYVLSLSVFYPIGALVQAALAHHFGVRPVSLVAALSFGLVVAALSFFRPQYWHQMASDPSQLVRSVAD
ncbi:MAG: MFS transporter [Acidimicrobiaceae bacterium]|nr:MFS transporter [Acidimicrobiaceae bacterium]